MVFVKVILLAMPQLVVLITPIAILVGGSITISRLRRDNEVAICFASGMSRWRLIAPAIRLSAMIATLSLLVTLWIQPLCYRALRDTLDRVRTDLIASLIKPGQFTHPAPGLTVYAQSLEADGTIRNLFIDRRREDGRDMTIMARDGRLQRRGAAPLLILRHGASQDLSANGVLNFLSFDNYILDLRPLIGRKAAVRYKLSDRYIHELVYPKLGDAWEQASRGAMLAEAHSRLSSPLYNVSFMVLALAAVLEGSFSRLGQGGRIATMGGVAVLTRTLGFAAQTAAAAYPLLNILQYGAPLGMASLAAWALFRGRKSETLRSPTARSRE
jgi:lipopolysaccharide export system permease protein